MFRDRVEAGQRLVERLGSLDPEHTVILALPRGGLPVAEVIASALDLPLDVVLVRKVGFPGNPELALAAVTNGEEHRITINRDVARASGLGPEEIEALARQQLPEIARRRKLYLEGRPPLDLSGKTVVVVDDGAATGATMRAALQLVRAAEPAVVIAALPVAPPETVAELAEDCDRVICLEQPVAFGAVGAHFRSFDQVPDEIVAEILGRHMHQRAGADGTDTGE